MRRRVVTFALLSGSLLLAACGEKELSREEVVENIEQNREEVENYETLATFDVKVQQAGIEDKSYSSMDLVVIEPTNEMEVKIEEDDDYGNTVQEMHYVTEDTIYSSMDGNTWSNMPQAENYDIQESVSITYGQLFDVFETIEEELEFEEKDDYYLFSFDDTSKNIFNALDEPYNASVSGIGEDEMVHDLVLKVDKENFYFMEFVDELTGEVEDSSINLDISHTFSNINEIEEIEVPDEVYD